MNDQGYISAQGIRYEGTLPKIRKKDEITLQPIFEAFTNSLESIKILKERHGVSKKGEIIVSLFLKKDVFSDDTKVFVFDKIQITDSGVGFDSQEFERVIDLNDNRKGYSNKGSGRVQFLHSFDKTEVKSVYRAGGSSTGFKQRIFTLSKSAPFLNNNAIIRLEEGNKQDVNSDDSFTTVLFKTALQKKDDNYFRVLTALEIKECILDRYLAYLCENTEELPRIIIKQFVDEKLKTSLEITAEDIPVPDQDIPLKVHYIKRNGTQIEKTTNTESFNLKAFRVPQNKLNKNGLKIISKGEIARDIKLDSLLPDDVLEGNRYLFLLSGSYIDDRDTDTRGEINIPTKSDFKKDAGAAFLEEEVITLDDIEEKTNNVILNSYEEIKLKNEDKKENIAALQRMFLLNPKTLQSLGRKISINDSDDKILRKVYEADVKLIAKGDAEIKRQIESLDQLNTADEDYQEKLISRADELVKTIPIQNRTALTHYIARRKLVLELFSKIIKKQLEVQKSNGGQKSGKKNIDEKLLHNLIFQQSSENPDESDLWLVNEDFIYFKGTSEGQLGTILLDGDKILKEELTEEEESYRLKQQGDANQKRPDILLFPKEGKCIIIEFKSLDTNISQHLNQINRYASLINNLSKDQYNFNTYYGYLVGENIDVDDIIDNDSDYVSAHHLNFIYRPYKRIAGKFGKGNGSLYTEVIKYSTLLERALLRNKIFIDKLTKTNNQ